MIPHKIKAIIIDDEAHCRSALKKQIEWSIPSLEIIGEFENATSGEKGINELSPDLVFLDIEMPDKNGFDLLRSIENIRFEVIFTTAYDSFAIEAFRVNAVDYLLKPIDEDQLIDAVDKVAIHLRNKNPDLYLKSILDQIDNKSSQRKIPIPTAEGITFLTIDEMIRCEAQGSYSYIHLAAGHKLFIAKTLKYIENLCQSEHLVRVHQSHLINIQKVKEYIKADGGSILMADGSNVPLARSKRIDWKKLMN